MTDLNYIACLNSAITLAHHAAAQILPFYRGQFVIETKGGDPRNLVTEADRAAERKMVELLRDMHPDHAVVGEEGTGTGLDPERPTWVLDPIDGTNNFAHRFPLFAVNIGLYHRGRVRVAVTYAPLMGWLFTATEGGGATLNGQPLQVSARSDLTQALASSEWARSPALRRAALSTAGNLLEQVLAFRSMGSAALSLAAVAAGWLNVYYNYSLEVWDIAAGALLIAEAGGTVTHIDGSPLDFTRKNVLATNGGLHEVVLPLITPPPV